MEGKENRLSLWNEFEIIDREEHWRIQRLKESVHMLGYNDLLSRPSIEMNTIWEPIIKNVRFLKNLNMSTGNESCIILVILVM